MSAEGIKKKILIVDDEPSSILILRSCLQKDGFEVFEATNGYEALSLVKKNIPDLIIMDQMMPKMDGIKTAGLLKVDTRFSKIPVIMLTASADKADQRLSEQVGISAFMNKPLNTEAILAKIKVLLGQG
ncbi:MAG: response regulator [Candidatus Omnitrophica bacterium]|nr:response regulator [Candidatus Omnitrophota bacterium]